MYSSLYGDYLTPVFVQVLVANLLEQQRNQTPGAGQGFQGQPKAMVWPTKCDLRHGEVSKKKKRKHELGTGGFIQMVNERQCDRNGHSKKW